MSKIISIQAQPPLEPIYFNINEARNNKHLKEPLLSAIQLEKLDSLTWPEIVSVIFPISFTAQFAHSGQSCDTVVEHAYDCFKDKERVKSLSLRYYCEDDKYSDTYRKNIISIVANALQGPQTLLPNGMKMTDTQLELLSAIVDYAMDAGISLLEKDSATGHTPICDFLKTSNLPEKFLSYLLYSEPDILSNTNVDNYPVIKFCLGQNIFNPTNLQWLIPNIPPQDIKENLEYVSTLIKSTTSMSLVPTYVKESLDNAHQQLMARLEKYQLEQEIKDNQTIPHLSLANTNKL